MFKNNYNSYLSLLAIHCTEKDGVFFRLLFLTGLFIANFSFSIWFLFAKFLNHIDVLKTGIQGWIAFLWGVASNILIFPAVIFIDYKLYCKIFKDNEKYSLQEWLDNLPIWITLSVVFSFFSGVVAYIFYNSGIDPLLWDNNYPYKYKEVISTFYWSFVMAIPIFLIRLLFCNFQKKLNRILHAKYLLYTYIWIFFTVFLFLLFYFIFCPTDEKIRGILTALGLRSGIFLGLYFSVIQQNIEKEFNINNVKNSDGDIMDGYSVIVVEATKFIFNELSKWLDRVRKKDTEEGSSVPQLTRDNFEELLRNSNNFLTVINKLEAERHHYELQSIVDQLQIHKKNLIDFESVISEYGILVPQHVKRGIEREENAITDKTLRLKLLLETIYSKEIR